ncbi:hypothetical protein Tco_0003822 [Tanacetum coccineum]
MTSKQKQHGVNIMVMEVQIKWLRMWPKRGRGSEKSQDGVELITLDVAGEEVVAPGGVEMVMSDRDRGPWKNLGSRSSRLLGCIDVTEVIVVETIVTDAMETGEIVTCVMVTDELVTDVMVAFLLELEEPKVCIRTKHMDIIQVNMPIFVDGVHICIRIRELLGESHELFFKEHGTNSKIDDESATYLDQEPNDSVEEDQDDESDYITMMGWMVIWILVGGGFSGGIIAIWDDALFKKHHVLDGEDGFIAI